MRKKLDVRNEGLWNETGEAEKRGFKAARRHEQRVPKPAAVFAKVNPAQKSIETVPKFAKQKQRKNQSPCGVQDK